MTTVISFEIAGDPHDTCTGWLKLKYHTGQNAISRQPCEIFTSKFLDLYGRDPATIMKFKKKLF